MAESLALAALFCAAAMTLAWFVQRRTGRSGWIDAIWSLTTGIAAVGLVVALAPPQRLWSPQSMILAVISVWSVRLGLHLARRTARGGDDPRYAELMRRWGAGAPARLFGFLQIQALATWVLALAVASAAIAAGEFIGSLDILALVVAIIAVVGEGVADRQLTRFRADPSRAGEVCDIGLWGWSRHPNYVFEWLGWCAYPVFALGGLAANPIGLLSAAAPVMMYYFLVHASGIPHLEAHMRRSRGERFEAYCRRVPAFWPRRPQRPAPRM